MSTVTETAPHQAPGRLAQGNRFRRAGWPRAALFTVLGVGFAFGITCLIRALYGSGTYDNVLDGYAVTIVALIAAPFFFFVGIGAFDYWFYWASGKPTRPEDHSSHGAQSWRDYFRVNTDHKVIGIQYTVTSFFFLLVGGLIAMLIRAELAQPGIAVRRCRDLQRPLLRPRVDPDLPVHHPRVRGPGELRAAADDRRAGHGVPAAQRAVLLDAPGGRHADAVLVLRAGRLVRHRLDGLCAPCRPTRRSARCSSPSACSSRAPPRSRPR